MDTKDLIFEFVEGNTTPEQESILFSEISGNTELQELLKHAVAVDSAINENQDYFSPSVETTNSVFATLGMDLPGSTVSPTFYDKFGQFYSRNEEKLKNGLILLLLLTTSLLLINDFNFEGSNELTNSNSNMNSIPLVTSLEVPSSETYDNATKHRNQSNSQNEANNKLSYFNEEIISSKSKDVDEVESKQTNYYSEIAETDLNRRFDINTAMLENNAQNLSIGNSNVFGGYYANIETVNLIPKELQDKFSIEIRQTPSWATQSADIMPSELNTFNNTDIRLYYNVFSTLDIGIGIRQETFDQVFSGMANDGREVTYYQKPNFTSFTANARYIYDSDLMLDPYMEASFGFNRGGIVSRAGTGFNISLFKDLNLMVGVEYSNLNYNFQNAIYNSSNFGINYGVRYKF